MRESRGPNTFGHLDGIARIHDADAEPRATGLATAATAATAAQGVHSGTEPIQSGCSTHCHGIVRVYYSDAQAWTAAGVAAGRGTAGTTGRGTTGTTGWSTTRSTEIIHC